jgi:hypothetical protein
MKPAEPVHVETPAEPDLPDFTESPLAEEAARVAADVGETIDFQSPLPLSAIPDAIPLAAMPNEEIGTAPVTFSDGPGLAPGLADSAPAWNPAAHAPGEAYPAAAAWQPDAAGYVAAPEPGAVPAAAPMPQTGVAPISFNSPAASFATDPAPGGGVSAPAVAVRRGTRRGSNLVLVAAVCLGLLAAVAAGMMLGPQLLGNRTVRLAEDKRKATAAPSDVRNEAQPTVAAAPAAATSPEPPNASSIPVTPPATPPSPRPAPAPTSIPITAPDAPPPAQSPAPAPAAPPPPAPEPPQVTREEAQALVNALKTARKYLGEQKFNAADVQMVKAESLARLPLHKQAVGRLKEAGGYARQFREAVEAAIGGMQAGETFKVGSSTQVSFVEALPGKVIFRISGMNRTYAFEDLPPGLAVVVADFKLPEANPQSKVVKGAYLALHERGDSQTTEKARSLWEEARTSGANVDHLLPLLEDDYSRWLKDAP